MKRRASIPILTALGLLLGLGGAYGQTIGGNASLPASTSSANVALPASLSQYPAVMVVPAPGTSVEAFYAFGGSSIAATTSSNSLPSGGLCLASVGPNGYIAAITASGTATLRITQLTQCPQNFNSGSAASAGSGGGGGSVTITGPVGNGTGAAGSVSAVAPDELALSGSVSSAATLFSQDMSGYNSATVFITANAGGNTISFESSDDNTNWALAAGLNIASINSAPGTETVNSTTTPLGYVFGKRGRYFRARVSTYVSGTTTVVGNLHNASVTPIIAAPVIAAGTAIIGSTTHAPTSSSSLAISHGATTTLATSLIGKASAGNLYGFNCTAITGGAAGYCVAINAASVPSTGTITGVMDVCYFSAAIGGCSLARPDFPAAYSTGIVILVTSAASPFTYTTGTDTAFISADYE